VADDGGEVLVDPLVDPRWTERQAADLVALFVAWHKNGTRAPVDALDQAVEHSMSAVASELRSELDGLPGSTLERGQAAATVLERLSASLRAPLLATLAETLRAGIVPTEYLLAVAAATATPSRRPPSIADQKAENPSAYEPWSEEEDDRLRRGWADGQGRKDLAEAHGRSSGAITRRLERLGILDDRPDR
jgi:hypothetical protein